jgi:hypothetical protein
MKHRSIAAMTENPTKRSENYKVARPSVTLGRFCDYGAELALHLVRIE